MKQNLALLLRTNSNKLWTKWSVQVLMFLKTRLKTLSCLQMTAFVHLIIIYDHQFNSALLYYCFSYVLGIFFSACCLWGLCPLFENVKMFLSSFCCPVGQRNWQPSVLKHFKLGELVRLWRLGYWLRSPSLLCYYVCLVFCPSSMHVCVYVCWGGAIYHLQPALETRGGGG